MNHTPPLRRPRIPRRLLASALSGCLTLSVPVALAQSTSASLRGQILLDSAPAVEAQVIATNTATGLKRMVQAVDGRYGLSGLPPGRYRIDVDIDGRTADTRMVTLAVGQAVTLDLAVDGATAALDTPRELDTVTVVAPAVMLETRTSELATYIGDKQIRSLPQGTRNFLAFADTVPGLVFSQSSSGNTSLRSGAQTPSATNVYIDGIGQKSYTLPGGVSGQDSSRGNPFPQSAIGEYKVISSNYKAEFDQISSAAIVAASKSGGNRFQGDVFWDKSATAWRARTPAEEKAGRKEKSRDEQYGASLSGPVLQDRLHYFIAYEAKEYDTPRTVELGAPSRYAVADVPAHLLAGLGAATLPFKQDMYFGKLSWSIDDRNLLEFSSQVRREDEIVGIGGQNLPTRATVNANDVTRHDLRWQFNGQHWLNDAHLTYEDTSWAPHPASRLPGYRLMVWDLTTPGERQNGATILSGGGGSNDQDKGQKGWGLQNDLTFTGWRGHTLKMGVKYKAVDVNAAERHYSNPQYDYDIGLSVSQPFRVEFGRADVGTSGGAISSGNRQFGIYIQDDWEVNEHLLLNLGLRWDHETTPSYENYRTPQYLVDSLRAWPNIHQPGVDYDIEDYISDGRRRRPDKNNWAPRLGFSYDVGADQRHVIFGGAGRAYDRNLFDYLQVERNRTSFGRYSLYFTDADGVCRQASGCLDWEPALMDPAMLGALAGERGAREWYLNNNDLKVPYSDQYSIGMRNLFDLSGHEWNSEIAWVYIHSREGLVARLGNRREDGTFFPPGGTWGTPWGFDPPFGRIVLIDNGYQTKTRSLLASLNKPYDSQSGWGVGLSYTYTDGKQNTNASGWIDMFEYPNPDDYGWLPARGVAKHRFVGTGIVDGPWGLMFSAKLTLETPKPRTGTNCLAGSDHCFIDWYTPDGTFGLKRLDLAVTKEFDLGDGLKMRLRGDVLNATNARNWESYDDWWGDPGAPNPGFGRHRDAIVYPTRMFKLSFGMNW